MNLSDFKVDEVYTELNLEEIVVEASDYGWHTGTGTNLGDCVVYHADLDHDRNMIHIVSFVIIGEKLYKCIFSTHEETH